MALFPASWRRRPPSVPVALAIAALVPASVLVALAPAAASTGAGSPVEDRSSLRALPLYEIDLTLPDAWDRCSSVDLDFLQIRRGWRATVLGWPGTLEILEEAGLCYTEITPDYGRDRAREAGVEPVRFDRSVPAGAGPPPPARVPGAPPFGEGSIAGHWTYDEVCALLDSLAANDAAGILTEVDTLGLSLEGRPILALGVAAETAPLGTRPEALFTALTHAREPAGMQSILYTLLRLVEDYGVDPELTYLVDRREIWFVPVVNPDGYVLNEETYDQTGGYGYWRKNLRDNDQDSLITSADGVDLNRNFGYEWGYDDQGSSPNPASVVYRGPAAFSEPETQALRDFCLAHEFRTANNYHTYYEVCLYPWAYDAVDTPDSTFFIRTGDAMMETSYYAYGRSGQLLYPVNGDSNDWMYGEDTAKPKTFAFTTEVGDQNDGFWAPPERILPLAAVNHHANRILAYAAGVWLTADSLTVLNGPAVLRPGEPAAATLRLNHAGATGSTGGGIAVTVTSGNPAVTVLDGSLGFGDLAAGDRAWPDPGDELTLHAEAAAVPGTLVPLYLAITDGDGYVGRDTLLIRLGEPVTVFADDAGEGLLHWSSSGAWGIQIADGDSIFSDSPGGDYAAYANETLTLNHGLDLTGAVNAVLRFRTQWEVETGYDFALIEVSADSGATWTAVPGLNTRPGHGTSLAYSGGTQPEGVPGYDGSQRFWIVEEADLSAWAGEADLRLRFRLRSDVGLEEDGWWLDDLAVLVYVPAEPLAVGDPPGGRPPAPRRLAATPNPFRASTEILFDLPQASPIQVGVYDVSGRRLRVLSQGFSEAGPKRLVWDGRLADGRPAAAGAYFLRLETPGASASTKVLLLR